MSHEICSLLVEYNDKFRGAYTVYLRIGDGDDFSLDHQGRPSATLAAAPIAVTALMSELISHSHASAVQPRPSSPSALATSSEPLKTTHDVPVRIVDHQGDNIALASAHGALVAQDETLVVWVSDLDAARHLLKNAHRLLLGLQYSPEPSPHLSPFHGTSDYHSPTSSPSSDALYTPFSNSLSLKDFCMYDQPDSFDWPYQSIGYAPLINLPFNGDYPGLSELPELAKLVDLSARNPSPHSSFASVAETHAHSPTPDHTSPVEDDALAAHRTHAPPPSRADVAPRVAEHCYSPPKGTTPEVDEILPGNTTSSVSAASQGTKSRRRAPGRASAPQRRSLRCAQLATARPPMPPPPPPPKSRASTRRLAKLPARRALGAPQASTSRPISALPSRAARPVALHPSSAVAPRASGSRLTLHSHATRAMSVDDMSDSDEEDESDREDEDEYDDGSGEYTGEASMGRPNSAVPRRPLKRGRKATGTSKATKKWQEAQERLEHPEAFRCPFETCPRPGQVFTRAADCTRHKKICAAQAGKEDAVISMCSLCGKEYSRADATLRHIRAQHLGDKNAVPVEFTAPRKNVVNKEGA